MPDPGLLTLEPNGTITCWVGETRHKLRRPTVGDLRRLWEGWEDTAVAVDRVDETDSARIDTLAKKSDDPGSTPAKRAEARAQRHELVRGNRAEKQTLWAKWIRDVFATLSGETLPDDDDDLEPWMLTVSVGADFLRHWQTVPKASG